MEAQQVEPLDGREAEEIYNNENVIFSEATRRTIEKIRRRHTRPKKALLRTMHDNTSPGYEWLLLGWVAEERQMQSGRICRYYYDPDANFYRTKTEVIFTWEQNRMILIDDD